MSSTRLDLERLQRLVPCWNCQGEGMISYSESGHHSNCGGECLDCPIEIKQRDHCPDCGGSGIVVFHVLKRQVLKDVKDNLRVIEILEGYKKDVRAKSTRN